MTSIVEPGRGDLALELVERDHPLALAPQVHEHALAADADDLAGARALAGFLAPVAPAHRGAVGGLGPLPGHVERLGVESAERGFHLGLELGVPLPLERELGRGRLALAGQGLLEGLVDPLCSGPTGRPGEAQARRPPGHPAAPGKGHPVEARGVMWDAGWVPVVDSGVGVGFGSAMEFNPSVCRVRLRERGSGLPASREGEAPAEREGDTARREARSDGISTRIIESISLAIPLGPAKPDPRPAGPAAPVRLGWPAWPAAVRSTAAGDPGPARPASDSTENPSMATPLLDAEQLEGLRRYNTPTISNAIELFDVRPRDIGFLPHTIRACCRSWE